MKVVLNTEDIKTISLFQKLTGSRIIDCYNNEEIYIVVGQGQYGLTVGKNGIKIKNAENIFKKKIKVFEYSDEIEKFIRNLVPEAKDIAIKEKIVEIKINGSDRARVIGKEGKNINIVKKFLNRLYDIEDVKLK